MPIIPGTGSLTSSQQPILVATPTGSISDIKQDVTDALQQRTDIPDQSIALYAARTIRELTSKYPFEELRATGPTVGLTIGNSVYPVPFFLNPQDGTVYTWMESLAIFVDFPTNTVTNTLDYKTPKAIEQMISLAVKGLPSRWTRFGQNIHLGPNPDKPYSMFARYQIAHPFSVPPAIIDFIYMPLEWYDIIAYGTAERIAIIKRWPDQAKSLHDALWGDPEFQMSEGLRGRPGLVAARLVQPERDQKFNSRALTPIVSRYTPR